MDQGLGYEMGFDRSDIKEGKVSLGLLEKIRMSSSVEDVTQIAAPYEENLQETLKELGY
jgi:hypothetical protein